MREILRKKTFNKGLILLMALLLILSAAACGDSESASGGASDVSGDETNDTANDGDSDTDSEEAASENIASEEYLLLNSSITYPLTELIYEYTYTYVLTENSSAQVKYCVVDVIDQGEKDSGFFQVQTYDEEGKVTSMVEHGVLENSYTEYEYDEVGNLVQETTQSSRSTKETRICTYEYDESGNRTKFRFEWYYNSEISGTYEYEYLYNTEGKLISAVECDEDGQEVAQYVYQYTYDEAGNVVSEIQYDESGEITYQMENTYVTQEEYFLEKEDQTSYDSCEKLAEDIMNDIVQLNGAEILNKTYDGIVAAMCAIYCYSEEELTEELNDTFEDALDDALEYFTGEDAGLSCEIKNKEICPEDEMETISNLIYPYVNEDDVWKLEVTITIASESGEALETTWYFYVLEEENEWYLLLLSDDTIERSTSSEEAGTVTAD